MSTNTIQLALLGVTSLLFAAAFLLGLRHMRRVAGINGAGGRTEQGLAHEASMGVRARWAVGMAMMLGLGLLVWRAVEGRTLALPLSHPFDAFLVLGLLLGMTVIYFRWTRHLRSFSFFLLPMIATLLVFGMLLAALHPAGERQDYRNVWTLIHVMTIVAGTICFSLGCVGGGVYLLADRQLRRKGLDSAHRWIGYPPLGSLEKFNRWMIYCGFPLLTISILAAVLGMAQGQTAAAAGVGVGLGFKIALGALSWVVYGVLLHVPLNPRFRGRRAAWLSIVGFVLFIGAFAAVRWS